MTVNVYWSFISSEWLRAEEPQLVLPSLASKYLTDKNNEEIARAFACPAVTNSYNNLFSVKSLYDYEMKLDKQSNSLNSNMYNQSFFNEHVILRDSDKSFISFMNRYIFFTEESSLEITACIPPYYENNFISNNVYPITGKYDIGKWFRGLDFAFFLKDGVDTFSIKSGDIFSYIKFETNEKIKFKKFMMNEKLNEYSSSCSGSTNYKTMYRKGLGQFYQFLGKNMKKNIIKEIKSNLV